MPATRVRRARHEQRIQQVVGRSVRASSKGEGVTRIRQAGPESHDAREGPLGCSPNDCRRKGEHGYRAEYRCFPDSHDVLLITRSVGCAREVLQESRGEVTAGAPEQDSLGVPAMCARVPRIRRGRRLRWPPHSSKAPSRMAWPKSSSRAGAESGPTMTLPGTMDPCTRPRAWALVVKAMSGVSRATASPGSSRPDLTRSRIGTPWLNTVSTEGQPAASMLAASGRSRSSNPHESSCAWRR